LLRPLAPSDLRPTPVVVDRQTAAAAGHGGRLELTVDGLPVRAVVVGTLDRLPTVPSSAAGFVLADVQTLAAALDAQQPGQGRADELWVSGGRLSRLEQAVRRAPFDQLSATFRAQAQHALRDAPLARGVLGTLIAATVLAALLAAAGLLVALLGGRDDERIESDLLAQGVGPRTLRAELQLRLLLTGALGVLAGFGIAVLLSRLAVAVVRAVGTVSAPYPALLTVTPWGLLLAWSGVALAGMTSAALLSTARRARR
jgi:hypothetical protein